MEKENPRKNRWEKRVLLLFADDKKNRDLCRQIEIIQSDEKGFGERELETYLVLSDAVETLQGQTVDQLDPAKIRQDYEVRPDEFRLLLIGKDGTVKMKESFNVENGELFKTIDAMPRQTK